MAFFCFYTELLLFIFEHKLFTAADILLHCQASTFSRMNSQPGNCLYNNPYHTPNTGQRESSINLEEKLRKPTAPAVGTHLALWFDWKIWPRPWLCYKTNCKRPELQLKFYGSVIVAVEACLPVVGSSSVLGAQGGSWSHRVTCSSPSLRTELRRQKCKHKPFNFPPLLCCMSAHEIKMQGDRRNLVLVSELTDEKLEGRCVLYCRTN